MESALACELFKEKLYDNINSCGLTIGAAFFIFKDVYKDLENIYKEQIEKEKENLKNGNDGIEEVILDSPGNISIEKEENINEVKEEE